MNGLATVFGGSGFVGAQIVRALAKRGYRIRVAVRRPGSAYRLPMLGDVGQIEIIQANLRDADSIVRALDGAQTCINAVGVLYESGRQSFAAIHVDGAGAVASAARAAGVRALVQISAIGADPNSASAYGRSKAEGEARTHAGFPAATIVRPSVVFGPEDAFFNRFANLAMRAPVLPLIGGGETRLQPVFVGDVAAGVVAALEQSAATGATYELGGPTVYSFTQLMRIVLEVTGRRRPLVAVPALIARLLARTGDLAAASGLMAPPLTSDQLAMLAGDNIVSADALGLADLGIDARALEPIIPTYLWRYRRGGQYAESLATAAAVG
ncbi:MAG TPA: complex I NDUFA9 subunit family protein [Caulobacteraceae bacterium]